jgi:glycosyltransferase involved in cell wall biosynthesis
MTTPVKFCHVLEFSNFNRLLYNSIKYSDREKFEYTVITFEAEGALHEQLAELGVRAFSVKHTSRRQALKTFWKLYRFFRREKIEIVQTHLFDPSLIALAAARLARVPVTIFSGHHSHEVPLYNRPLLTFIDGLNGRLLATGTLAPSENMKDIFVEQQKIPASRIEVIHHGFDLERWREQSRAGSDFKKDLGIENKIVFGAVGRLFWVKDFENLIAAFKPVAEKRDDVVLLIVGEGADQEKLQNFVDAEGLAGRVILTGARADIASVMNGFDVFVHSALAESFGMVFIEALALGKPIISTRVGVVLEFIEDGRNGFLVEPKNVPQMTAAMFKMLEQKEDWQKMGEEGRRATEDFAVQKTQRLCDEYYLKCLSGRRR